MGKKSLFLLIFCLVLIVGGFFLWAKFKKPQFKGSAKDYQILQKENFQFIENKKAGFKMKVPKDWKVEKIDLMQGSILLYSPDAQGFKPGKPRPPLKKGCLIETTVVYKKMGFEDLKKEIQQAHQDLTIKTEKIEKITVAGKPALKNTFESVELGIGEAVYVFLEKKLFSISIGMGNLDKEKCSFHFDEILNSLSFD